MLVLVKGLTKKVSMTNLYEPLTVAPVAGEYELWPMFQADSREWAQELCELYDGGFSKESAEFIHENKFKDLNFREYSRKVTNHNQVTLVKVNVLEPLNRCSVVSNQEDLAGWLVPLQNEKVLIAEPIEAESITLASAACSEMGDPEVGVSCSLSVLYYEPYVDDR